MADYAGLTQALVGLMDKDKGIPGRLGYQVGGAWRVIDPNDPTKYFVRFQNGTFVSAYHNNSVLQTPDLPVRVGVNRQNQPIILGVDQDLMPMFGDSPGATVGPHDHVRGSGREFLIDTWLLKQLKCSVVSGKTVKVRAGSYFYNGDMHWWEEDTIDLSAYTPSSSYQRWVVICIDPATISLVALSGDESYGSSAMDPATIFDIDGITDDSLIPIAAIWLLGGSGAINDYQIEDLRGAGGGGQASGILEISSADVSNPPTQEELDAAFPVHPEGKMVFVNDENDDTMTGISVYQNGIWWWFPAEQLFHMLEFTAPDEGEYTSDTTPTFTWVA